MTRVLVVPAAGLGTRLGSGVAKALTPVAGRPMISYVLARAAPYCQRAIIVAHPSARAAMERYAGEAPLPIVVTEQTSPTGMLDAILLALPLVAESTAARVWICWCDQVLLSDATVRKVADRETSSGPSSVVFPTVEQSPPYIHFTRDSDGRLSGVRQRREGDVMPDPGESDAGFFSLSREAFLESLPAYARDATLGRRTGEKNFLPFLPWIAMSAMSAAVATVPLADPIEACGINTPEERAVAESQLRARMNA